MEKDERSRGGDIHTIGVIVIFRRPCCIMCCILIHVFANFDIHFVLICYRVGQFMFFFKLQGEQINEAACDLARQVADEGDALVAGGVSQTPSYLSCKSEEEVKAIFKKQINVFVKKDVDFLIAEVITLPLLLQPLHYEHTVGVGAQLRWKVPSTATEDIIFCLLSKTDVMLPLKSVEN